MFAERKEDLIVSLNGLSSLAKAIGLRVLPFQSSEQVSQLSLKKSEEITSIISKFVDLYANLYDPQEKLNQIDEKKVLKLFLKDSGLRVHSEIFEKLKNSDIVEIYNWEGCQLFRNLQFLRFCSYDLLTLHSVPYFELYSRAKEFEDEIFAFFSHCKDNVEETTEFRARPHILKETFMGSNKRFHVEPKWASPVYSGKEKIGLLITNNCREHSYQVVS